MVTPEHVSQAWRKTCLPGGWYVRGRVRQQGAAGVEGTGGQEGHWGNFTSKTFCVAAGI